MAKFCGQCGSRLNDTALFCGGCGAKLPVATTVQTPAPMAPPVPSAPPPVQPGAYTPVATPYTPVDMSFGSSPASQASAAETVAFVPGTFDIPSASPAPQPPAFAPVAFDPLPATPPSPPAFAPVNFDPYPATPAQQQPVGFAPVPGYAPPPAAYTPPVSSYTPPAASYAPSPAAYTPGNAYPAKKSNTLVKVLVAVVLIIFVGGALAVGGLWYAAQQIKGKVDAAKAKVLGGAAPSSPGGLAGLLSSSSSSDDSPGGFKGDPCRFLSKAEVSQAIGIPVIRTEAKDGGCSYIAKGDPADVTAKHLSSMLGGMGADKKTQQMAQKFAGGLFSQQEATDKSLAAQAATGEIPVLGLSFTAGNAAMEMKMNRAAFQHIGGGATTAANSATGDLTGIGDEAYVAGGSMILVRKGNTVAHFMYVSCPCNTDNIKPLAQLVASRL
jgi:hypothetical protein